MPMIAPQSSSTLAGDNRSPSLPLLSPERDSSGLLGRRNGGSGQTSHQALLQDSFGYLVSKIVPGFFGLLSVPVFVRLIGIEEYGRLSLLLPVLMALAGAGAGWLQQGILRFHPATDHPDNTAIFFHRAVQVGTGYAVLVLSLLLLPLLGVLHYRPTVWLIAEIYCAVQLIYSVRLSGMQARLQPGKVVYNEILRSAASFFFLSCWFLRLAESLSGWCCLDWLADTLCRWPRGEAHGAASDMTSMRLARSCSPWLHRPAKLSANCGASAGRLGPG